MFIKIINSNQPGLLAGQVKNVPAWVGRDLINRNIAEETTALVDLSKVTGREIDPISLISKTKKLKAKNKVSAYMATFPARFDSMIQAVNSLLPQVDFLHLWCNEYTEDDLTKLDKSISDKKLIIHTDKEINPKVDLGCLGKFVLCESWNGYVLTVDDDFIYPENYTQVMIEAVEKYGRKAVISLHGRTLKTPIKHYHRDKVNFWQCTKEVVGDHEAHVIGTGVMALHTDTLNTPVNFVKLFPRTNASDIHFSIEMQNRAIPMMVIEHAHRWIIWIANVSSIGRTMQQNDTYETELINSINWKFNG